MLTIDSAARAKYSALFEQHRANCGGAATLDKANAGLHQSGLAVDTLLKIWALVDVDKDDRLSLPEYLMCCALIKHCCTTSQPPPTLTTAQSTPYGYPAGNANNGSPAAAQHYEKKPGLKGGFLGGLFGRSKPKPQPQTHQTQPAARPSPRPQIEQTTSAASYPGAGVQSQSSPRGIPSQL